MTPGGPARALRRPHVAALAASLAVHLAVAAAAYVDAGRPPAPAPAIAVVPVEIVAAAALVGEPAGEPAAAGGGATPIEPAMAADAPPVSAAPGAAAAPETVAGRVAARAPAPPRPRPRPLAIRTALAPPTLDGAAAPPLPRPRPSGEPPRARPAGPAPPALPERVRVAGANAAVGDIAPLRSAAQAPLAAQAPSAPRPGAAGPAAAGERGEGRGTVEGAAAPRPLPGNPAPVYPRAARERGWEGRVVLRVEVDADGSVVRADIEETSGHPVLDRAALGAVRRWRFTAGAGSLPPPGAVVRVPIAFRLDAPTSGDRGP